MMSNGKKRLGHSARGGASSASTLAGDRKRGRWISHRWARVVSRLNAAFDLVNSVGRARGRKPVIAHARGFVAVLRLIRAAEVKGVVVLAGAGLLTSCAVGPDYRRPEVAVPAGFKSATSTATEPAGPVIATDWWTLFQDEELNRLAPEALAANQDIRAAMSRVESARAAARGARGGFFPAAEVNASAQRSRSPARAGGGSATANSFTLPLDLSYELDVWGRLRREYEYYDQTAQASAADLAFVRQTVLAEVAQAYFTIRFYDSEVDILERNLALYREQLDLTQTKFRAGLALQTDVLQSQTQVNSSTNDLIEVRRSRAKQEHALAILLGRSPADFSLAPKPTTATLPSVPAGIPSALLSRRPDVAVAEHQLAAANASVGLAKAAFFPSFTISGAIGYQSSAVSHLTDWQNRLWSAGAGLNLPIFQGGRLTAALAAARADYETQVANYRSAVLTAFQDVEDQLSDLRLLGEKAESVEATLVSAREYFRLTELQYKQGLATHLQVIDANQTLLTNEILAAQTRSQRLTATVLLIRALGGGWSPAGAAEGAVPSAK